MIFFLLLILIFLTNWNTAKDKMWNGIGWYGFIGVITASTTDISLIVFLQEFLKILLLYKSSKRQQTHESTQHAKC